MNIGRAVIEQVEITVENGRRVAYVDVGRLGYDVRGRVVIAQDATTSQKFKHSTEIFFVFCLYVFRIYYFLNCETTEEGVNLSLLSKPFFYLFIYYYNYYYCFLAPTNVICT